MSFQPGGGYFVAAQAQAVKEAAEMWSVAQA
jgi:hypothetical protein